jgi:putative FmdB family regulatory protein
MPIFEYVCKKCGNLFEYLKGSEETETEVQCPNCESKEATRVFSMFSSGSQTGASGSCRPRSFG